MEIERKKREHEKCELRVVGTRITKDEKVKKVKKKDERRVRRKFRVHSAAKAILNLMGNDSSYDQH